MAERALCPVTFSVWLNSNVNSNHNQKVSYISCHKTISKPLTRTSLLKLPNHAPNLEKQFRFLDLEMFFALRQASLKLRSCYNMLCIAGSSHKTSTRSKSDTGTLSARGSQLDLIETRAQESTHVADSDRSSPKQTKLLCIYDFQARVPRDLSVKRGQWLLADMEKQSVKDWLWVYSISAQRSGYIPRTYAKPPNFGMDPIQYEHMTLRRDWDPYVSP